MLSLVVIYAYYDRDEISRQNLRFFFTRGYYNDPLIQYIIVINGDCSMPIPQNHNITILRRQNSGYDFGGYGYALKSLTQSYDYYFFINTSTRGPFVVPYCTTKWYMPFISLLVGNVKIVGPTINAMISSPHVQTYAFMMDRDSVNHTAETIFYKEYYTFDEVVNYQELGLSKEILSNGWNISCLIPEYQGINYSDPEHDIKFQKIQNKTDLLWSGKLCNGRDLNPYELIFIKTNRNVSQDEIMSITNIYMTI